MLDYKDRKNQEKKEAELKVKDHVKRKEMQKKKLHDEGMAEMKQEY
jgi:hypothetical protein